MVPGESSAPAWSSADVALRAVVATPAPSSMGRSGELLSRLHAVKLRVEEDGDVWESKAAESGAAASALQAVPALKETLVFESNAMDSRADARASKLKGEPEAAQAKPAPSAGNVSSAVGFFEAAATSAASALPDVLDRRSTACSDPEESGAATPKVEVLAAPAVAEIVGADAPDGGQTVASAPPENSPESVCPGPVALPEAVLWQEFAASSPQFPQPEAEGIWQPLLESPLACPPPSPRAMSQPRFPSPRRVSHATAPDLIESGPANDVTSDGAAAAGLCAVTTDSGRCVWRSLVRCARCGL